MSRPVLIGELNPYGADPAMALYPLPEGSSGGRLQRLVCGLRRSTYCDLPRYNLCDGKWSAPAARERANELLRMHAGEDRDDRLVLLGRKVVGAFFGGGRFRGEEGLHAADWPAPFTRDYMRYAPLGGRATEREPENLVILPHPSGLCRVWSERGAYARARALLRQACPSVPWGETDRPGHDVRPCSNCGRVTADNTCQDCGWDWGAP